MSRKVHLVGSLGLADPESVFKALSKQLGELAPRYPDGECGVRTNWVAWQRAVFENHPAFEAGDFGMTGQPLFQIGSGVDPAELHFDSIGYAAEAIDSYAIFKRLKSAGTIPAGTEFQVSLPTPTAVISTFVALADRSSIETSYDQALKQELKTIVQAIPHEELAIQWDIAIEVIAYAGAYPIHYADALTGTIDRVTDLLSAVPAQVTAGIHLCYGDPGHKHIVEPTDLGICVEFANALCDRSPHHLAYIHLPVPRDRKDADYFAPLSGLRIGSTRLVIGLVHHTDGVEGTRERMKIANNYLRNYDLATECGFGRRPAQTISELLDIHREAVTT